MGYTSHQSAHRHTSSVYSPVNLWTFCLTFFLETHGPLGLCIMFPLEIKVQNFVTINFYFLSHSLERKTCADCIYLFSAAREIMVQVCSAPWQAVEKSFWAYCAQVEDMLHALSNHQTCLFEKSFTNLHISTQTVAKRGTWKKRKNEVKKEESFTR